MTDQEVHSWVHFSAYVGHAYMSQMYPLLKLSWMLLESTIIVPERNAATRKAEMATIAENSSKESSK